MGTKSNSPACLRATCVECKSLSDENNSQAPLRTITLDHVSLNHVSRSQSWEDSYLTTTLGTSPRRGGGELSFSRGHSLVVASILMKT